MTALGVISLPKSGTYLASRWLERLGIPPTFHLAEHGYHDYRFADLNQSIRHPELFFHRRPLAETLTDIPDNYHWVGHLSCSRANRRILRGHNCLFLHRRADDAFVSYWNWERRRREEQSFETFANQRMKAEILRGLKIAAWIRRPNTLSVRFLALTGRSPVDERHLLERAAPLFGRSISELRQELIHARKDLTLTKRDDAGDRRDVWSERTNRMFMKCGGHVLNRRLGYEPSFPELFQGSTNAIRQFRDRHRGETVICVGCGPSLKEQDLSVLKGKPVIAVNAAHRIIPPGATLYHVISDHIRLAELRDEILATGRPLFAAPNKFLASSEPYRPPVLTLPVEIHGHYPHREFASACGYSDDISERVYIGINVVFSAIQMARYFGARTIALLGVDMDYSRHEYFDNSIRRHWRPRQGDYEANLPMFILCRDQLARRGIQLINATQGGRVDCLKRRTLEELSAM